MIDSEEVFSAADIASSKARHLTRDWSRCHILSYSWWCNILSDKWGRYCNRTRNTDGRGRKVTVVTCNLPWADSYGWARNSETNLNFITVIIHYWTSIVDSAVFIW